MAIYTGSTKEFSNRVRDRDRSKLLRSFSRSPDYLEVIKHNADGTTIEDFPIRISNSSNKQNNYKKFLTHPDYPVNYGDVIEYNGDKLIVFDMNEYYGVSSEGIMYKCEDELKWSYQGTTYSQPCYIKRKTVTNDTSDDNISLLSNSIELYTQKTDAILNVSISDDFVFGDKFKTVYTLLNANDTSKEGMVVMSLEITQTSAGDNLDDNVADNPSSDPTNTVIQSTIDDSYYVVNHNDLSIRTGETVNIVVEHYDVSDVLINTTYSYSVSGVSASAYELGVLGDNSLDITGVENVGVATLEITDNSTSELIEFSFELIGLW